MKLNLKNELILKNKKMLLLIVCISLIFLIGAILLIIILANKFVKNATVPPATISPASYIVSKEGPYKQFQDYVHDRTIGDILKDINVNTIDSKFDGVQEYQNIKVKYKVEKLIYKGSNFELLGFSNSNGGDVLIGGGCMKIRFKNYMKVNNNLYPLSVNNIAKVLNPNSFNGFIDLTILDGIFNQPWCGIQTLYYNDDYNYSFKDASQCDKKSPTNIKMTFDQQLNKFSYFVVDIGYPATLSEHDLVFVDKKLYLSTTKIVECQSGVYF